MGGGGGGGAMLTILWMDEIHFAPLTMGSHCMGVQKIAPRYCGWTTFFLGAAKWISPIHSRCLFLAGLFKEPSLVSHRCPFSSGEFG